MARRAAQNGHAIDVFLGCLDQVGLLEMKSLSNYTNGYMILADSFNMSLFKQSFQRVFAKDDQGHLQMGFNATFDVQVSPSPFSESFRGRRTEVKMLRRLRKNSKCRV